MQASINTSTDQSNQPTVL